MTLRDGAAERWCGIGDEAAPDLSSQLRVLGELGLSGIELRTISGRFLHQLDHAETVEVADHILEAGLEVPVIDTPIGNWSTSIATSLGSELALLGTYAVVAQVLDCPRLRVMSWPNDGRKDQAWAQECVTKMSALAREAEHLGLKLLHENCAGWAGQGPSETLHLLEAVNSPALGLVMDLGNGLVHGYDAYDFLAEVAPWVEHVHVKDGRRGRGPDAAVFTVPGTGQIDLTGCLQLLDAHGYTGWWALEPHVAHIPHLAQTSDPDSLADGFGACVAGFRDVWASASNPSANNHTHKEVPCNVPT